MKFQDRFSAHTTTLYMFQTKQMYFLNNLCDQSYQVAKLNYAGPPEKFKTLMWSGLDVKPST